LLLSLFWRSISISLIVLTHWKILLSEVHFLCRAEILAMPTIEVSSDLWAVKQ
jgi:hypothetical protein